ncbi:MAG TPA: gfo/Idh/MocA family oxidoreductase, partial [Gemmataceae bacterium]|nr:gfo/Idh/MocA family oxidoreductase [Gemmataceae bacterium]
EGHLSAALCHLANISLRLGKEVAVGELKEIAGSKEASDHLRKMVGHLEDNKVDLKSKAMYGPLLKLDPKTEKFIGNDRANGMLARENRKGYEMSERA